VSRPLVVVGDALLDIDLVGSVSRIAPDAPVPVLADVTEHVRPGGAALAAVLAARDGYDVALITPLASDPAAQRLVAALDGVRVVALPYTGTTPVKQRVRAGGHSLVRIDTGDELGTIAAVPDEVADALDAASAVLVSDYGRGTAAVPAVRELLGRLPGRIPVVWDPHPRGTDPVPGVHLMTPNAAEARHFASLQGVAPVPGAFELAAVCRDADALVAAWRCRAVAVTRGAHGALLTFGEGAPVVTPAPPVHTVDPCGAGDRFAVSAAVALGAGAVLTEAVQEAVRSASAYVAAGGPASLRTPPAAVDVGGPNTGAKPRAQRPTSAEALAAAARASGHVVVATGGCFDLLHAGHIATLRAARELGDCLIVCVNSDDSVRRLKGPARPLVPAEDRVRVLEALECVDAVMVFAENTPTEALRRLRPHVWAKGGDYAGADVPEAAVLRDWGGQAVVLPYLAGRSTTSLVTGAAASAPPTLPPGGASDGLDKLDHPGGSPRDHPGGSPRDHPGGSPLDHPGHSPLDSIKESSS
jgi:D-beta-D-heptose 7-phosphate kinase / D-beta-D-heptose 1-phosphate adenosyltransferase